MEDIDTVAGNIAEEAAKDAAEDNVAGAAKATGEASAEGARGGPVGEAGKATAEEEVVDDQPPSSSTLGPGRYLKVGDDLFVHLLGASSSRAPIEGEVFDKEVLAAAGLEVVDEPSAGGDGSREERLLQAKGTNFRKLQALHRARLDNANSRAATVDTAEAELKVRVAEMQTWFR